MNIITMPWSLVMAQEFNWTSTGGVRERRRPMPESQADRLQSVPALVWQAQADPGGGEHPAVAGDPGEAQGRFNVYRIPMIDPMTFDFNSIPLSEQSIGVENAEGVLFQHWLWIRIPAVHSGAGQCLGRGDHPGCRHIRVFDVRAKGWAYLLAQRLPVYRDLGDGTCDEPISADRADGGSICDHRRGRDPADPVWPFRGRG